jgi:hypothetical protein
MALVIRAPRLAAAVTSLLTVLALWPASAVADAGWFEADDVALRLDLLLLNDAGIITVPVNQWPLPRATIRYAVSRAKDHFASNGAVQAALARVRRSLEPDQGLKFGAHMVGGRPARLRSFDSIGREEAEIGASAERAGDRFSFTARASWVNQPQDGQQIRLDRSAATVRLGNWLVSANTLDRFWGPSFDSSLILSNNPRPMPTLMVERAEAREFESRWLNWLGPWRFNFALSRMESERQDIDEPLFLAWRVTVMPWRRVELGFSRTAQFCGEQLPCSLTSFKDLLLGDDNPGFDATPETEPGNQMAGFDIRWRSPLGDLPYAIYGQMIGEDESGYLPVKYLQQFGIEAWRPFTDGSLLHGFVEYIDTTCKADKKPPQWNCAYNQTQFNVEGYRYRGRVIGHTADRDAEGATVGLRVIRPDGSLWMLNARSIRLNRDGDLDLPNTVAQVFTRYHSLTVGWRTEWLGGRFSADIGAESAEAAGEEREIKPVGFLGWSFDFDAAR